MIVILGTLIVIGSVVGGFVMAGGNTMALLHLSELVIIGGAAFGALVLMSPKKVLIDLFKQILGSLKGSPYNKKAYDELFKALYELFMLGRRGGMVALEEHIMNPENSTIFSKYPGFQKNKHAMEFL
jgi:chemotaxis protein MotA